MTTDRILIYEAPGADPAHDRVVRNSAAGAQTVVAVASDEQIVDVARDAVAAGARLVELCGGVSPVWRARVAAAVGDAAHVSSVTYGIDSLDAAGRYKAAYERGERTPEAFLLLEPDADPERDRFEMRGAAEPTRMIPVPDADAAVRLADRLAGEGTMLIELYGGFSTGAIARVIEAVDGRAAVGAGSLAIDAIG